MKSRKETPGYRKGDYVIVQIRQHEVVQIYQGKSPQFGSIVRAATADEVAVHKAEVAQREAEREAYQKRTEKQDWQDAGFIAGMLDNEREKSIELLGAAVLRDLALKLGAD